MNTLSCFSRFWLRISLLWKCEAEKETVRLALLNDALAREGKRLSGQATNPLNWRAAVMRGGLLPEAEDSNTHNHATPVPTPVPQLHVNHVLVLTVPERMLRWRK